MGLLISDEILQAAGISEEELAREIAVLLFQQGRLTLAKASKLARMSRLQFQHLLASRQIPVHYDVAELEEDLRTLRELAGE
ncbi:MAG: UPF0175 family protein [Armatimonadetes bacterium]|nr:UPF0175 family protein [Armatimonadota bacterium]MDW8029967.1 UPF0175 family protein [Armatimonadota bacterium]